MPPIVSPVVVYALYAAGSIALTRMRPGQGRDLLFAALNLTAVFFVYFGRRDPALTAAFLGFVLAVVGCWVATRRFALRSGGAPWLAFFAPIVFLAVVRWFPVGVAARFSHALAAKITRSPNFSFAAYFVGLSYLAFRSSRLVIDVRNGAAPMPSLAQFLGFAFFLPVMVVGPIHAWPDHHRAIEQKAERTPLGRPVARIVVGLAKFCFMAGMANQLAYAQLLLDGHLHPWPELILAAICYYLFLYFNFSGACDIAIGFAGLAGIPVPENFNAPFLARNLRDFWNRWHITLSEYMRDMLFAPLSKKLVGALGPARANHAVGITIVVVFLTIGIWHGTGWNYAVFGLIHAAGVAGNHYYTIFLKRRLSKEAWRKYNASGPIKWTAVTMTLLYVSASLFFFANSPTEIRQILGTLR